MELTLNQVILNLESIADKHQQLHGFKFGDAADFATSGTAYAAEMWVQVQPAPIGVSTTEFSFRMWLLDAVRRGEVNETEVLSDMAQVAKDVVSQLRHPDYSWDFNRGQKPVLNYFTEESPYKWAGVWFDFTLIIPDPTDTCRIPFSSSPTIYPTL